MASKARTYDQKKLLGQVYTPLHVVEKILDKVGFYNFAGKKVLDPACGDGRFLVPIAEYIIRNSPRELLIDHLSLVNGWDIDPEALAICRKNLDTLIEDLDMKIDWNLKQLDALKQLDIEERFDLIVGNPPYIRVQHLPENQRKYVQSVYSFCKTGSTDIYIAFFQLASTLLTRHGVCGFITPNSFFSSETARPLRSFFEWNQNLIHITNYGTIQVFENAATYSAITIFGKVKRSDFYFEKCGKDLTYSGRKIQFSEISDKKNWQLSTENQHVTEGTRLGEVCQISVGVTTLSDSLYLFTIQEENGHLVLALNKKGDPVWLERDLLKPIVKGSKLKTSSDAIKEYILFPYQKDKFGKHRIVPENILQRSFPKAYEYLLSVKPKLDQRDNGKPNAVSWYAFGRSQGLDTSFGEKIIFSPMNLAPNFILYDNPDCTIYSGYFIKYKGDYDALLAQLNSKRMADFIDTSGRDFQGGYKGYNKKILENFVIAD
jgi:adenine-specific DNA-methyltransferase